MWLINGIQGLLGLVVHSVPSSSQHFVPSHFIYTLYTHIPFSIHNTLYLEVHCPAVKPELVVISDNGRPTTDFGDVSIGQSVIKSITIQNISDKPINVSLSWSQLFLLGGGGSILRLKAGLINEDDARPWQYTVWTVVCLRLRVMLGHDSTQSGLLSAWDWGWC